MRFHQVAVAALAAGVQAHATPLAKRQVTSDFDVLNYALTLEFLERKFYQECLSKFNVQDFFDAGFHPSFSKQLHQIALDEQTHVDFLSGAIIAAGGKPVNEATYNFPLPDARSCVTLASVLEGVGVSAYLGAAASILEKRFLTAAGSILTIEARHSAFIRAHLHQSPFPQPFDAPLTFNQVFSLAATFITGFAPEDPPLPFTAFPPLTIGCSEQYLESGVSPVSFAQAAELYPQPDGAEVFVAFFSGLEPYIVPATVSGADLVIDKIPPGVDGQTYAVLTNDAAKASDDTIIAGPVILEVFAPGYAPSQPPPKCA